MTKVAVLKPWLSPAPFKIDGKIFEHDVRDALVEYCCEIENMYDYCDGDFTAVFDLTSPLFLEDLTDGDPEDNVIDYTAVIKSYLPKDYNETTIGVYFCNG